VLFRRDHPTEEQEATSLALISKRMQIVCEVFLEACEADLLMARGAALLLHATSSPWPS
jgi:Na+-translocating ferredoxin:NAD+ oxidoreductase RNF subunit RnfB